MKKTIICLMLAAMLSCSACGNTESVNGGNDSSIESTQTEIVTTDPSADELPDDLNFGGETVTFFYRSEIADEFYSEEANGDVVNDALYDSHSSVEERLNVKIEVITQPGQNGEDRNTYMNQIRSSVMANDDVYDWVDLMVGNAPVMMQEGIFRNLSDNKYINPDKPYYMDGLAELCTIDGKLYFISGDASLGYLQDSFCIFFNKAIAEEYKLGNLYDIVEAGEWTLDKLMELSQKVCKDLDGDGKYDDKDQLGFRIYDQNHISGFIASTELDMCKTDANGDWKFDMSTERNASIVEKLHRLIYESDGSFMNHVSDCKKFANDEVLFITAQFDDAAVQLREMKSDYGILPYPKFGTEQEKYYSNARTTHNSFSMPMTCGDPEMAGAVMEAIAAKNYKTVTPAYFELALKTKFASDEETAKMYDIIRGGMRLDFGFIFSNIMANPVTSVFINSVKGQGGFASNLASFNEQIIQSLETYMETVRSQTE